MKSILEKYKAARFKYGTLDCCLFVCDVIKDMTGKDLAEPWRGKYKTELQAFRLIRDAGGFQGLMCQAFGEMRPIWSVKKGNPVMLSPNAVEQDAVGYGLGIFDGDNIAALTDKGLVYLPVMMGRGCWHV